MSTFADEVYREIYCAPLNSERMLNDVLWRKCLPSGYDQAVWMDADWRSLSNEAMYEATINAA